MTSLSIEVVSDPLSPPMGVLHAATSGGGIFTLDFGKSTARGQPGAVSRIRGNGGGNLLAKGTLIAAVDTIGPVPTARLCRMYRGDTEGAFV